MRQRINWEFVIVSCVLAILLAILWRLRPESNGGLGDGHDFGGNNPNLYAAIGDSITAAGYPVILSTMLGKPVMNFGVKGSTSLYGLSHLREILARCKPGYVLILYGANDLTRHRRVGVVAADLRKLVELVRANGSIPVIATLTPMFQQHAPWNASVKALNSEIRFLAQSERVTLVDLEQAFEDSPQYLQPDGLHPTAEGCAVIAGAFHFALTGQPQE